MSGVELANTVGSDTTKTWGRKIIAFIILNLSVAAVLAITAKLGVPAEIASTGLWVIGLAALGLILGQAGVDAVLALVAHKQNNISAGIKTE